MSFAGDGSRRYGHVPPVQYPVPGQSQQPQSYGNARRQSFNSGDDTGFLDNQNTGRGDEELFLTSPTETTPSGRTTFGSTNTAMSGFQHQYQAATPPTPSTYNPQAFARSQSTSLPYHPHPAGRYGSPTSTTATAFSPQATGYTPAAYNPAAYNPAAYASTAVPQRQSTYHGYNTYNQSYGNAPLQTYGQSPNAAYAPTFPQPPPSATSQSSYDQPLQSPGYASPTHHQTPSYDPSNNYSTPTYGAYSSNGTVAAPSQYSAASPQAPYPAQTHIPTGTQYAMINDSNSSFHSRASRSNSQTTPPMISPPIMAQTSPGLQRHPTNAPLPSRPLDNLSEDQAWNPTQAYEADISQEQNLQDDLFNDIEAELGGTPGRPRPAPVNGQQFSDEEIAGLRRFGSTATTSTSHTPSSSVTRYPSVTSTAARTNAPSMWDYDDDDSDPEGVAGVLAMKEAEMEDRRFSGGGSTFSYSEPPTSSHQNRSAPLPPPPEEQSSDSDFAGMDIGMFSGGFAGSLAYGNDGPQNPNAHAEGQLRPLPTPQGSNPPYPTYDNYEEAPAFRAAEMDYGGTGGLQPPSAHRLSFDDGEEQVSIHSRQSGSESPLKEDYYDQFFYHPGLTNRPLPALPPGSDTSSLLSVNTQSRGPYQHNYSLSADSRLPQTAEGSDSYYPAGLAPQNVERSVSLSSHSHTPQIQTPARSRTDAAEERKRIFKQQQQLAAQQGTPLEGYDTGTPMSMTYDTITLPTGRKRKFVPSKLTAADIKRCAEPWALSGIAAWIREMADGEPDLRQKTIEDGLVKLFTSKVPTMNIADAETLSTRSIEMMLKEGILVPEEEWVKFGQGQISGVLWQLTGSGCYAPKLHEYEAPGRCYSHHCGRTLRKANVDDLLLEDAVSQEDWATFYKLTKELVEASGKNKKEIERQNILHEIVTSEEVYMTQLDVLKVLYRENLRTHNPPIIPPKSLDKFLSVVFGKVEMVQKTNKDNLLAQLKYRQQEQGPWIIGFSDLFREWIRKAKNIYIEYAANFPYATHMVRKESDRNLLFRQFLDQVRGHKRSGRLDWTHFLKAPVTRLQRYSFLLETVEKTMKQDSEEKTNLAKAIAEIKIVTLECDARVAEMQKKVEMMELNSMLVCRPGLNLNLNLDHLGRELIMQGDLQRLSGKGVKWVNTHALLFDHYFILAKVVTPDRGRQEKKFNVSKDPIPMPLLFLESANDEAVNKQKGITAPLSRATATSASDTRLNKIPTNGAERPGLEHTTTGSSIGSLNVTRLTPSISSDDGKILYPFRIKHLGHEVYTLYATTPQARQDWCNKIIEAKTRHAKALFSQNAEPFRLRVLADSAFSYDSATAGSRPAGVSVRGTPLDRAIRDLEKVFGPGRGPAPVCRATVNCATGFTAFGKSVIAIGTDYGVYISDATDPRGWQRTVQIPRVTQIAVLEEFSICLVISDRSLIAYPLDVVAPVSNFPAPAHDNPRRAPQRLAKDVAFFATARMKERMLLFYKRKEGLHNTFKVLEPVFQKSTEKKTRLFGSRKGATGSTESFRDFDEFYLPTECYSLNLFQTYIAVSTAKGIELLTLDKKQTMSIPDLKQPAIANIAQRIRDQRPLGMFKLNDQEFLLTYEDCAVYVDKHGDVSRTLIMEYSGTQKKARGATMYGQYLLLFNEDYVEVRNAENGRLRQIIAGRDVRCLDYGIRGPTPPSFGQAPGPTNNWGAGHSNPIELSKGTVKIAMSHPEIPGMQIVLEMLLNDGHTEK